MKINVIYFIAIFYIFSLNVSHAQKSDSLTHSFNLNIPEYKQTKSPTGAMLRSMVLPGWGQLYNESYWKIPIVWGSLGAFGYAWKWNNDKVNFYQNKYETEHNSAYYNLREFYRNQRDLNTVFLIIVYLMNVVDAYVDAHMFDFETRRDFSFFNYKFTIRVKIPNNFVYK